MKIYIASELKEQEEIMRWILAFLALLSFSSNYSMSDDRQLPPWNQTSESSINLLAKDRNAKGVASFVVPDPEAGAMKVRVINVKNINFDDASMRAVDVIAFQWHSEEEWKEVEELKKDNRISCGYYGIGSGAGCGKKCICSKRGYCAEK